MKDGYKKAGYYMKFAVSSIHWRISWVPTTCQAEDLLTFGDMFKLCFTSVCFTLWGIICP